VLERSGVRGVVVRLERTWMEIRSRADYPDVIAERLGECCAAAALFTGHTKVDGRLTLQLNGHGPVRTLFAECTHDGTLRGIAQFTLPVPEAIGPRDMGPDAVMAITIESRPPGKAEPVRYQGLVGLDAEDFPAAFEGYFAQSEQLPTRIVLAGKGGRVSGLMIQQLPGTHGDPDGWARACALLDTLGADELQSTPVATLLYRLFHEDEVRLLGSRPLAFGCSCSRERVANVLISLGSNEAMAAAESGVAQITCEFCNAGYDFSRAEVAALFALPEDVGRLH
jgi:molecular chaperone Hsp33